MIRNKKEIYLFLTLILYLSIGIGIGFGLGVSFCNKLKSKQKQQFNQSQQFIPPGYFKHKERNHLLKEKIYG